ENREDVQDAEILEWQVEGVEEPTTAEIQALCSKPEHQLWEAQRIKRIELQAAHAAEMAQGVTSNGHTFSLQALKSQFDITAMAAAVQTGMPTTTRPKLPTIDGPRVELSDTDVVALAAAAHDMVADNANR